MEYRYLTGTGVQVSRLCLGTMMFGGQTSEKDSIEIVKCAIDGGINFIDTADVYNNGASEIATGKGIKGQRDKIILATKVMNPMGDDRNDRGLSRRHILSGVEASLKRLGTDYIDLYYMHSPDYHTPIEESLEAMSSLVKAGKVRYIGISNYASWQACDLLWTAKEIGAIAPVVSQNVYNMLTRGLEQEFVPFIQAHNIGLTIYNPIAAGLLAGKYQPGQAPASDTRFGMNQTYMDRYWSEENFKALDRLTALAKESGMTMLQLAMKWCCSRSYVDSIITGVSRRTQLEQNIASIEGSPLSPGVLEVCDDVWKSLSGGRFKYNR